MSFRSIYSPGSYIHRASLWASLCAALLLTTVHTAAAAWFTPRGSSEVAPVYKANRVAELDLAAYEDELIDCSALAGIHTWIGDELKTAGADVRMKINQEYWLNVSKAYLSIAEQAAGEQNLSKQMGARMRVLASEFRQLTESPDNTANWTTWYDLVDRCDTWRTDKPSQAFFNNGRKSPQQARKDSDIAKAPF